MLTCSQQTLANVLFEAGAIKFGRFKIKAQENNPDLPDSPIYLNLRTDKHPVREKRGPLKADILRMVRREIGLLLDDLGWEFDRFTDIPDAGTPFGDQIEALHISRDKRLVLAKRFRDDGSRYISHIASGDYVPYSDKVLVLDDVITGADSKLETIQVLEDAGLRIWRLLVLVDRCQGGADLLRRSGYDVSAVMTLPNMIRHYVKSGRITIGEGREVLRYLDENQLA